MRSEAYGGKIDLSCLHSVTDCSAAEAERASLVSIVLAAALILPPRATIIFFEL
jgi:hypothetical protein